MVGIKTLKIDVVFSYFLLRIHKDILVRGDRDSRATLMPIYGDLYQVKL